MVKRRKHVGAPSAPVTGPSIYRPAPPAVLLVGARLRRKHKESARDDVNGVASTAEKEEAKNET